MIEAVKLAEKSRKPEFDKETIYEADITDLAVGGKGLTRINGKVVFVEKAIPGQRVTIRVFKEKKEYAEARVVDVLENSSMYEKPKCSHFSVCGGCSIQNMKYTDQIIQKRLWIDESFKRIAKIENVKIDDTIPSPDTFYYRNKMEFSFSNKVWDPQNRKINTDCTGLGLHLPGRFDAVINVDHCYLQSEQSSHIVRNVRKFAEESGFPAYDVHKNKGFWKFLIIREGKKTGQTLLNIITNKAGINERAIVQALSDELAASFDNIASVFHAEHPGRSQAAVWETIRKISGNDYIEEKIGSYVFRVECETFFQTNTYQVENLYEVVKNVSGLTGNEIVYDLFSGVGTIPVYLSNEARKIIGFEIEPSSVEAARLNARRNNVSFCYFVQGKVRSLIKFPPKLFSAYGKPDVIITDPPRSGMDQKTLERLIKLTAPRIIYISCNPSTLARDIRILSHDYNIERVVPVDMFPHTSHVESVTLLVRKEYVEYSDRT